MILCLCQYDWLLGGTVWCTVPYFTLFNGPGTATKQYVMAIGCGLADVNFRQSLSVPAAKTMIGALLIEILQMLTPEPDVFFDNAPLFTKSVA